MKVRAASDDEVNTRRHLAVEKELLASRPGQVQSCSRILTRVLAKRLSAAAEKYGWLSAIQWGFRSGRSVVDTAMIFRVLVEEQPQESPHDGSLTFLLLDVKKAFQMLRGRCAGSVGDAGAAAAHDEHHPAP